MGLYVPLEWEPADELHCDVRLRPEAGIGRVSLVNLRDARMLQASKRLRFLTESAQPLRGSKARLDHFDGHPAARLLLFGFVNRSHAAFANQSIDSVAADRCEEARCTFHRQGSRRHLYRRRIQKTSSSVRLRQERQHFPGDRLVTARSCLEKRLPVALFQLQSRVVQTFDFFPTLSFHENASRPIHDAANSWRTSSRAAPSPRKP